MRTSRQFLILFIFAVIVVGGVYLGLNRSVDVIKAPVTLFVGGVEITEAGQWIYSEERDGGRPIGSLTPTDGDDWNIKYSAEGVLTLRNVEISAYYDHLERENRQYSIYSAGDLTIVPEAGTVNTVAIAETEADMSERYGIYCFGRLDINGTGTLKVETDGDYGIKGLNMIIGSTLIAEGKRAGLMNVPTLREGGNALSVGESEAVVYGEHTLSEALTVAELTMFGGASLTVPEGLSLTVENEISDPDALINNGTVTLPE